MTSAETMENLEDEKDDKEENGKNSETKEDDATPIPTEINFYKKRSLKHNSIRFFMCDEPNIAFTFEIAPIRKVWMRYLN